MGKLLTGQQLRKIFDHYCPFDGEGNLRPVEERVTLCANNSNNWWQTRAFVQGAAQGDQSPMVIQFSYNANRKIGGAPTAIFIPEGVSYHANPVTTSARIMSDWLAMEVEAWGADFVAASLDHFNVPKFSLTTEYERAATPIEYEDNIDAALAYLRKQGLDTVAAEVGDDTFTAYSNYLRSVEYRNFRADFLDTVSIIQPAWGMIDTEGIPPVLDFIITKDITSGVRTDLNNNDMMLEAELGATGKSGDEIEYEEISDEQLAEFAHLAASFIAYTGAEGIAYDIGMKHSAKSGEKHPTDARKLEVVQRTIIEETGIYAPFAQHGGTGAADVPRSLIGKTNLNTCYLVAGTQARFNYMDEHADKVRAGDKSICGTDIETHIYLQGVYEEVVRRFEGTGSWQLGPELARILPE